MTWKTTWLARLHVRLRRWLLPRLHHPTCPLSRYEYIRMVELFHHRKPYPHDYSRGCQQLASCRRWGPWDPHDVGSRPLCLVTPGGFVLEGVTEEHLLEALKKEAPHAEQIRIVR